MSKRTDILGDLTDLERLEWIIQTDPLRDDDDISADSLRRFFGDLGIIRWKETDGQFNAEQAQRWEDLMLQATRPGVERIENLDAVRQEIWRTVDQVIEHFQREISAYSNIEIAAGQDWRTDSSMTPFSSHPDVANAHSVSELASIILARNEQSRYDPYDIRAAQIRIVLFRLACLAMREQNIPTIDGTTQQLDAILGSLSAGVEGTPADLSHYDPDKPNTLVTYTVVTEAQQMINGHNLPFGACFKYAAQSADEVNDEITLRKSEAVEALRFVGIPGLSDVEFAIAPEKSTGNSMVEIIKEMLYKGTTDPTSILADLGRIELIVRSTKPSSNDQERYQNDSTAREEFWEHLLRSTANQGQAYLPHDIRFHQLGDVATKRGGERLGLSCTLSGVSTQAVKIVIETPQERGSNQHALIEGDAARATHKLRRIAEILSDHPVHVRLFTDPASVAEAHTAIQSWERRQLYSARSRLILHEDDGKTRRIQVGKLSSIDQRKLQPEAEAVLREAPSAERRLISNYPTLLTPRIGFWDRADGRKRKGRSLATALGILPLRWREFAERMTPEMKFSAMGLESMIVAACGANDMAHLHQLLGEIHGDPNETFDTGKNVLRHREVLRQLEVGFEQALRSISGQAQNAAFDKDGILTRMKSILRERTAQPYSKQDFPPDGILNADTFIDLLKYALKGGNAYERYMGILALETCFTLMAADTARNRSYDAAVNRSLNAAKKEWNDHIFLGMFERKEGQENMLHDRYLVIRNHYGTPIKAWPVPESWSSEQYEKIAQLPYMDAFEIDRRRYRRDDDTLMQVGVSSRPKKSDGSLHDKIIRKDTRDATHASGEKAASTDLTAQQLVFDSIADAAEFMRDLFVRQEAKGMPILIRDLDVRGFGNQDQQRRRINLPAFNSMVRRLCKLKTAFGQREDPRFIKFMLGDTEIMIFVNMLDYIAYHKDPNIGHEAYAAKRSANHGKTYLPELLRRMYPKRITTPPTPPSA